MGTSSGRMLRWDVLRTLYFNVQRTSVEDVLRTSAGDVPWRYIEDHMGTSIGRLLEKSLGRARVVILPSGWGLWTFCFILTTRFVRIVIRTWFTENNFGTEYCYYYFHPYHYYYYSIVFIIIISVMALAFLSALLSILV